MPAGRSASPRTDQPAGATRSRCPWRARSRARSTRPRPAPRRAPAAAGSCGALPVRPVAGAHHLQDELDAPFATHRRLDLLSQAAHVRGRAVLVVDDEVGVLLTHHRAADTKPLQAELVDDPPGRFAAP